MTTVIQINDITCYGYHGVLPEEQALGQEFRISLELVLAATPEKDLLSETVDYRKVVTIVLQIMRGRPQRLLETLAEEIASKLLHQNGISSVKVSVCKPHPPIAAVKGGVIVRSSKQKNS